MTKHEIVLWKRYKQKLNLKKGELSDFTNPFVANKIRVYISPPVWKPPGVNLEVNNQVDKLNSFDLKRKSRNFIWVFH